MPELNWIGKQAVLHHHNQVPYRLLKCDAERSAGDPDSGNLLVQGDNLHALKALLPYYAGQVKCIYIDPPYNTGNENWVYNDAVNSPEIKQWLHKAVGGEETSKGDIHLFGQKCRRNRRVWWMSPVSVQVYGNGV